MWEEWEREREMRERVEREEMRVDEMRVEWRWRERWERERDERRVSRERESWERERENILMNSYGIIKSIYLKLWTEFSRLMSLDKNCYFRIKLKLLIIIKS